MKPSFNVMDRSFRESFSTSCRYNFIAGLFNQKRIVSADQVNRLQAAREFFR
jgi:hypothetical protein